MLTMLEQILKKMTEQSLDGTTDAEPITSLTDGIDCSNLCNFVLQVCFLLFPCYLFSVLPD
jgi:hypothetical protein